MTSSFSEVAEIVADPAALSVYEHGWQSWSPVGLYPATATSPRPLRPEWQTMGYRPDRPAPGSGFQGEGLLAVVLPDGGARLWVAPDSTREVPSIRAGVRGDRLVVSADGEVEERGGAGLAELLTAWADELAAARGVGRVGSLPPAWCSWYGYWPDVTEQDVLDNLAAIERLDLPIGIVQVDDGHQAEIGDWLERSPRFAPSSDLAARIVATGRRAGVWTAPFLVGERSRLAAQHPDWLVEGAVASPRHWNQEIRVLDVTNPAAAQHLTNVYASLVADGFTYHKIDFVYGGAMEGGRHADCTGLDAYREGLRLIRAAIGPDSILLGCGAPLLPSVGLVDAMRVGPDIDLRWESDDLSQPAGRSASAAVQARGWMHARFWVNDPDCLIARPEMEHRDEWAEQVIASGGLTASGDPLDGLDDHGLELTRTVLRPSSPDPIPWSPRQA
jgi:alpha-galactosidase